MKIHFRNYAKETHSQAATWRQCGSGDALDTKSGKAPMAQLIHPAREKLTPAQLQIVRQEQLAQWQKTLPQPWTRTRNIVTGLRIGAPVLATYSYTSYSVSQERFLHELEDEAKTAGAQTLVRASGP
ncbi:PREDICTED: cytochrome c oxidase assembly protein 3 homolog, mitochondrial-like [Chrysochloris asiatica]|uniref:Cytochrome c oxidase assembly factor 3 n=1 Tax=Chrysochloris asiatica TaxID=185453 RepID=A0A9B0WZY7_CHRAS|nr:PREDICTED: cytochrome c oxidase assembly protein 3 homolog, mitochondrial-like [Chrysochloris asiatica]